MLRTRILTAAIALPAVLAAIIFLPNIGFSIFIAVVGLWSLHEVWAMSSARGQVSILVMSPGLVLLLALLFDSEFAGWNGAATLPLVVAGSMLRSILVVTSRGAGTAQEEHKAHPSRLPAQGTLWVGTTTPYFALLRNLPNGIPALIFMLLVVIASDTGAYFGGRQFGTHKLAERVSPNKTTEGAVAGLIASVIVGLILRPWLMPQWSMFAIAGLSAAIAILAQLGDLAGSAFKRTAGVKDSGWIFPGHGGLIDRTCSLLFAAAFTYYCVR